MAKTHAYNLSEVWCCHVKPNRDVVMMIIIGIIIDVVYQLKPV